MILGNIFTIRLHDHAVWSESSEESIIRRVFDDNYWDNFAYFSIKHTLWVPIKIASPRRFQWVPTTYVFMENWQKLSFSYHKIPSLSVLLDPYSVLWRLVRLYGSPSDSDVFWAQPFRWCHSMTSENSWRIHMPVRGDVVCKWFILTFVETFSTWQTRHKPQLAIATIYLGRAAWKT